jgi:hypothetical protein
LQTELAFRPVQIPELPSQQKQLSQQAPMWLPAL